MTADLAARVTWTGAAAVAALTARQPGGWRRVPAAAVRETAAAASPSSASAGWPATWAGATALIAWRFRRDRDALGPAGAARQLFAFGALGAAWWPGLGASGGGGDRPRGRCRRCCWRRACSTRGETPEHGADRAPADPALRGHPRPHPLYVDRDGASSSSVSFVATRQARSWCRRAARTSWRSSSSSS